MTFTINHSPVITDTVEGHDNKLRNFMLNEFDVDNINKLVCFLKNERNINYKLENIKLNIIRNHDDQECEFEVIPDGCKTGWCFVYIHDEEIKNKWIEICKDKDSISLLNNCK